MAPVADDSFFPPLDRCLAGDTRLISWRTAYRALCDEESAVSNSNLEHFLNDSDTISYLIKALDPFPGPSQRSNQELDTKTAPINVSQNSNGHYKLDEIKADAKWLSQEMGIDEMVALRMAIVEWQERPADQLLNTALNAPSSLSSQIALASSTLAKSSFNLAASTSGHTSRPALDFFSEDVRRRRLVDVCLSEKNHLLKLSTDLVSRIAATKNEIQAEHVGALREHVKKNWIDELATKVYDALCSNKPLAEHEAFCTKCIGLIGSILDRGEDQRRWPKRFLDDPEQMPVYVSSQYTELVTLLRLLLANLYAYDGVPGPASVNNWFSVMRKCNYLQDGAGIFEDREVAELLVSVVSVEILKPQMVIREIVKATGLDDSGLVRVEGTYIKNDECARELTTGFYEAATSLLACAAPAIYAWGLISSVVRDIADTHREAREKRIDESGVDARRLREFKSGFESLSQGAMTVREWEVGSETTPSAFMSTAVNNIRVYETIAILNDRANVVFGSDIESATVFICKEALLDLIREGLGAVAYTDPVVNAILAILTPAEFCRASLKHSRILAGKIFYDKELFQPQIVEVALSRYPYELPPVLALFTALANVENENSSLDEMPEVVTKLDALHIYTQLVHFSFNDYVTRNEQLGNDEVQLANDLPIFVRRGDVWEAEGVRRRPQRALPSNVPGQSGEHSKEMFVPADTTGRIVNKQRPFVFQLQHEHSGLEYFGLLLSTFTPNGDLVPATPGFALDRSTATGIVQLFTALVSSALEKNGGIEHARTVLGRLSAALRNGYDIAAVVSEVLESELLSHLDQTPSDGSLELATACIEFLIQLIKITPERVWSILFRSSLLGVQDGAVSLASVVGGMEIMIGRYRFLDACTQLHASLVEDALAGLVKRKKVAPKSNHRFAQDDDKLDWTPDRTMSAVLNSYQKILLDVLQNLPDWKFRVRQERCNIAINILDAFTRLLKSTYGVDVAKDPSKRLTNVLAPGAEALLNVCAPRNGPSSVAATFGRLLPEGLPVAEDSLPIHVRGLLIEQTKSSFQFLTTVIRSAKSGVDLFAKAKDHAQVDDTVFGTSKSSEATVETKRKAGQQRARTLASDLMKHFPVFVSLLVSDHSLKADLYPLLSEVVQALSLGDEEPPSILAQLDAEAQKAFLLATTQFDRPLCDLQVERRVWHFLSTVMSSKQYWFATFLLTGELPKKRVKSEERQTAKPKSILTFVLDQLSSISILPPERATGMLKFVATAQQIWVWANTEIRSHPDFLKNTLAWIDTLGVAPRDPSPGASIISAKECEMAAYLCDIFAISIHAGLETGDKTVLKSLVPKLNFLREHGVTVNAYNRSLHRNLTDNLRRKFPQSDLSDFKRTEVNPATYGPEFFYDRGFATSVFRHDKSWHGGDKARNQGFSDEFARANANLSLLHAQMKLLKSWKTLAITLCEVADQEPSSHVVLAQVAEKCLLANADPQLDVPGAATVLNERIELAFVLCSKVVNLKVQNAVMKDLVKAAWDIVRTSPVDYDIATVLEDVEYYRQLLQVLYLTIQPHGYMEKSSRPRATDETQILYLAPEIASILVSIVGKVVAPGFRALCGNIHTNLELALPADFAMLTALLQSVISVPGISSVYTLLSDIVADSSLVRGALSLYSWSDQLAEATGHDPIFGEVAVMFVLALSTVPPIAEQMALAGVLTQLSASNLSNYFRKPNGKGPFDEPQRMFVIWSEAFLPLCLNLLDAVGPPIAAEVGAFLNSFPEQLRRAEKTLRNETPGPRNPRAGAVTLGLVAEANSLSMISVILNSDVARAAAEGINAADIPALDYDVDSVKSLVEALSRKRNLSERLTPVNAVEERWLKTTTGGTDNVLMQKALKEVTSMLACVGSPDS